MTPPPVFDAAFRARLTELMVWRRDVRRFIPHKPVSPELVAGLLETAALAPSVGNSQPWRFVLVEDTARRAKVVANFERANKEALGDYSGEKAKLYAGLKLAGLKEAPVHLAVFADEGTGQGHGLGRRTMPEMLDYSAVMAVYGFWLAARAVGLGAGWVSIFEPDALTRDLDVPVDWKLVAYLCVGWPEEEQATPELERAGWEHRRHPEDFITKR
ncbi:5,6-dimethylbenzimidazole synthase [Ferrovibrio sp.]|uniref:5,6-dimethylbenzimidazole synthase n=1 Tax=Ferrovibrio sp. TaxID=1917215 RepID=UPI0025C3B580|nr:5,6-dimethylbenzimidazole synthase [Ferrovibrio sp.]